jgi:hypothetical protein
MTRSTARSQSLENLNVFKNIYVYTGDKGGNLNKFDKHINVKDKFNDFTIDD